MSFDFSTTRKSLTSFSLASLTDIVLLLLIFFLLTSSFIPQFGIQVNLPQADAAATTEAQSVNVAITAEGLYYVGQQEVAPEGLAAAIEAEAARLQGEQRSLILRADQQSTIAQFAAVASIAKALDLRVLMATEQAPE